MKEKELTLVDLFYEIMVNVVIVLLVTVLAIPIIIYLFLEEFLYPPYQ